MLTVKCSQFYRTENQEDLTRLKEQYRAIIVEYNANLKLFADFSELSGSESLFNLKVLARKRKPITALYDFQTSATEFLAMPLTSQMDEKVRINFKIQRGFLLQLASEILRDDINVELNSYISKKDFLQKIND